MPIEFRCHRCQRLLRTADDSAGKQTKCPECGTILDIPLPGVLGAPPPLPSDATSGGGTGAAAPAANPYASPTTATHGAALAEIARGYQPTTIDVGDILNRTWTIFTTNLLQLLLGTLILIGVSLAMAIPVTILGAIGVGVGVAVSNQGNEPVGVMIIVLTVVVMVLAIIVVSTWIQGGLLLWVLKIARGEPNRYGDIFGGGPYFARLLGGGLLVALAFYLGLALCIVPGIFVAIIFSQFVWLVLDRDTGALESLSLSNQLTVGNKLNLFLILLLAFVIHLVASFIPLAGLFSVPFIVLLFAVTYLRITGQSTADMLAPQA
jgi:uncharacterized membrane protein